MPGRVEDNPQGLQNTATGQENSSLHFFVFYAKLCTTCVVFHRLPSEHPSEDRLKTWFAERFTLKKQIVLHEPLSLRLERNACANDWLLAFEFRI